MLNSARKARVCDV